MSATRSPTIRFKARPATAEADRTASRILLERTRALALGRLPATAKPTAFAQGWARAFLREGL